MDLFFYNGTSKMPFCMVASDGNEMYLDDDDRCTNEG
jgi:hypothetical protein